MRRSARARKVPNAIPRPARRSPPRNAARSAASTRSREPARSRARRLAHDSLDRLDVHVGLPASGDAEEQCLVETARDRGSVRSAPTPRLVRGVGGNGLRARLYGIACRAGTTSRSFKSPALTARAITAAEKPASRASASRHARACSLHEGYQRLRLLARFAAIGPGTSVRIAVLARPRIHEAALAPQVAAAHKRLNVAQQRLPIAGAARVGMAQQRSSSKPSGELVPDQAHQAVPEPTG